VNRIVLADPVFQAFRKQRGLTAIDPLKFATGSSPQQVHGCIRMYNSNILELYGRVGLGTSRVALTHARHVEAMTKLQSALSKLIIGATLAAIASPASTW
jgi:hypothetical protein